MKTNLGFNIFGDGFAPALGLGLRSKRGQSYGWRDNVVLEVHAKCEAKRTRGVDEAGGGARVGCNQPSGKKLCPKTDRQITTPF